MANPYTELVEQQRDESDMESNKATMFQFYKTLNPYSTPQADLYVQEVIEQFIDLVELHHYKYVHDYI